MSKQPNVSSVGVNPRPYDNQLICNETKEDAFARLQTDPDFATTQSYLSSAYNSLIALCWIWGVIGGTFL